LQPLDLSDELDIARLLEQLDISELETDDDAATSSLSGENATVVDPSDGHRSLTGKPLTNNKAMYSWMCAILWIFGLGSLLGLIYGCLALREMKQSGESGWGRAIFGIVLGLIGLGLALLWLIKSH
jgi:hypothetical protein